MRVWNVNYGFGTVIENRGQTLVIRFDVDPWFPVEVDLRRVVGAEILPKEWQ